MTAKRSRARKGKVSKPSPLTDVRQWRTLYQRVEFRETKVFTRQIEELLDLEDYAELQGSLRVTPGQGEVISGTGGCRKMRWAAKGKGKRGGARIIYYWYEADELIFLLVAYPKNEKDDLTMDQRKQLRKLIKEH